MPCRRYLETTWATFMAPAAKMTFLLRLRWTGHDRSDGLNLGTVSNMTKAFETRHELHSLSYRHAFMRAQPHTR